MNRQKLNKMLDALEEAAYLEGSELGEWWEGLISLQDYMSYCPSYEFQVAWENEIRKEYDNLQANFEITEESQTLTQKSKTLKYKGE